MFLLATERKLSRQQSRVRASFQQLSDIQNQRARDGGDATDQLVRIITDPREIAGLATGLMSLAQQDFMVLDTYTFPCVPTESVAAPPIFPSQHQVRCRAVYEAEYFDHPVGQAILATGVIAGEEARVVPRLPLKLKIVDDTAALVPLTDTGVSTAMLVRSPTLIRVLRNYFELLWERATPIQVTAGRTSARQVSETAGPVISQRQVRILRLMVLGLKDEAIARRTDASLRTVRREISAIMDILMVSTRFAAGAAARRLGLIE